MVEEIFEDTFAEFDTFTRDITPRQLLILLQKMKEEINNRINDVMDELESEDIGDEDDDGYGDDDDE